MQWKNLQKNKCPSCGKDFMKSMVPTTDGSIACNCGFKISEEKYKLIVADKMNRAFEEESIESQMDDDSDFRSEDNGNIPHGYNSEGSHGSL